MAITLEVWEDTGAATGSPPAPTTRHKVGNLGWKDSALDETHEYYNYPLQRPHGSNVYGVSYKKYYYFKISGTFTGTIETPYVQFFGNLNTSGGGGNTKVRLYYKWTNQYEEPNKDLLTGTYYDTEWDQQDPPRLFAPLTTTGDPRNATQVYESITSGSSYTSAYLVTQVYMEPGAFTDYGNIGTDGFITMKVSLKEKLELLNFHQYRASYKKWEW